MLPEAHPTFSIYEKAGYEILQLQWMSISAVDHPIICCERVGYPKSGILFNNLRVGLSINGTI